MSGGCAPRSTQAETRSGTNLSARVARTLAVACIWLVGQAAHGVNLPPGFLLENVASGLTRPVDLEWLPDGRLLIAEKGGRVRVLDNGVLLPTPFIDISASVNKSADRGLLGVAAHPDFPNTPWVYLLHTYDPPETAGFSDQRGPDGTGQRVSRLVRVNADPATGYATAVAGSEVVLLGTASTWTNIGDPAAEQDNLTAPLSCGQMGAYIRDCIPAEGLSHSIGTVQFGPNGNLFVGSGDAATWTTVAPSAVRALDVESLAGKVLRIDPVTGDGVSTNPFWDGDPSSNASKVWQMGLRNPYRFRVHPTTGAVWIGDVGWEQWEELNTGPPGADFGWPCYEGDDTGSAQQPGYAALAECQSYYTTATPTAPAYSYVHVSGIGGSAVAGDVYQHTAFPTEYHGKLFLADYSFQSLRTVDLDATPVVVTPFATDILTVDAAVGPDGALYVVNVVSGVLSRIVHLGGPIVSADVRVSSSGDDVEEAADGTVFVTSSDLEMTLDGSQQTVGVRFQSVNLPQGAEVASAYIQFATDETTSVATNLTIEALAEDDASTFGSADFAVSSRVRGSASASWSPAPWNTVGEVSVLQRTPDLTALVQEILDRPGWQLGNAMAFVVTGTGERVAESFNGDPTLAPLLHVDLVPDNSAPTVTIVQPADGTTVAEADPVTFQAVVDDDEDDPATLTVDWASSLDGSLGTGNPLVVSTLTLGVHTITASVQDSGGLQGFDSIDLTVVVAGNTPPVATIDTPLPGTLWTVDELVAYSGTGTDAEDGPLPPSALAWDVEITHNDHTHVDYHASQGASGQFPYPDHDDNSFLTLCLTVTDSAGAQDEACQDLLPLTATYDFHTDPSGLDLTYNALTQTTPFSHDIPVGATRLIAAPSPQGTQEFLEWSIGGDAAQQILIDAAGASLTATYNSAPSVTILSPADGSVFAEGLPIAFSASASDPESGDVSDAVQWSSSRDGPFAQTGANVSQTLSRGHHRITALATDVNGATGSADIHVYVTPANGVAQVVDVRVIAGTDDAEEAATGEMDLTSSDLEMVLDVTDQTVGVRLTDLPVPPGSVVTHAYIQFTADEQTSVATDLSVRGEATDDAQTFTTALLNLSSRPLTVEAASWSPPPWFAGEADLNQRTPELAPIVNEIVSRTGWQHGNAMAFIVTGVGERVAESHSGDPSATALLHLEFVEPVANESPDVTITAPLDGTTVAEATVVTLTGTASDPEDGDLSGAIVWASDLSGSLGSGASLDTLLDPGVHSITAEVTDSGGLQAQSAVTVTVEANAPPSVTISSPAPGTSVFEGETVLLVATATDAQDGDLSAQIDWSSDIDGALGTGASVDVATLSPGPHVLTASVADALGEVGSDTTTVTVNVNQPPSVSITNPLEGASFVEGALVSFAGSAVDAEDGDLTPALDWSSNLDGALGTGTAFDLTTLSIGAHLVTATVVDSHGEPGSASVSISVTANTPPVVSISSPPPGTTVTEGETVSLVATATDAEDGDLSPQIDWSSDVDGALGTGASLDVATLSPGPHVLTASVADALGEIGSDITTVTVNVNQPPSVSITNPLEGASFVEGALVSFAGSAADAEDGDLTPALAWSSNLDGALGTGAAFDLTTLSIGTHLVTATVVDSHGEPGSASVSISVTANTPPVVSISSPPPGTTVTEGETVSLVATATDAEDGDLSPQIDWTSDIDGALGSGGSIAVSTLSVGTHLLTAAVVDSHGVPGSATTSVVVNANQAPVVAISSPADGVDVVEGTVLEFRAQANDTEDGDLSAQIVWTSELSGALGTGAALDLALPIGAHTVTAHVTDSGTLIGTDAIVLTVRANTPPEVTLLSPVAGTTVLEGEAVALTGSATDAEDGDLSAQINWTSDIDGALGTGANVSVSTLSVGTHLLTAAATDSHGAVANATTSATVNVNNAPVVSIASPADGSTFTAGEVVSFAASATDAEDGDLTNVVSWLSDLDAALATGGLFDTSDLSIGAHQITAQVADSLGKLGSASVSISIVPNASPTVIVTSPPEGASFIEGTPVDLVASAADPEDGDLSAGLAWTSSIDGALGTGGVLQVNALSLGDHLLTASVVDSLGADGSSSVTINVRVNQPPAISLTTPTDGSTHYAGDTIVFTASAADPDDGDLSESIVWSSDVAGVLGTGASIQRNDLAVAVHAVTASVTDAQGATAQQGLSIEVIDNTPPSITLVAPTGDVTLFTDETLTLTGTASDAEDGDLSGVIAWASDLDGPLGGGPSLVTGPFAEGARTITAVVSDTRGAQASVTFVATVLVRPNQPPEVAIASPADGADYLALESVLFGGSATDAEDGNLSGALQWTSSLDGALGSGATVDTTALSVGTHMITAAVTDSGGLTGESSVTVDILPNALPVITVSSPVEGVSITLGDALDLAAVATDAESGDLSQFLEWISDVDGSLGFGSPLQISSLSLGAHVITAIVSDAQGQTATVERNITVLPQPVTVTYIVGAQDEDAQEDLEGRVQLNGQKLELGVNRRGVPMLTGLYFGDVQIPVGASILNASVAFAAADDDSTPATLQIRGALDPLSPPFTNVSGDLSARATTDGSVPWQPDPWTKGDASAAQTTPDIGLLVQEIVDQPGWLGQGNIVVFVDGSGRRVAEGYGQAPSVVPARLDITYRPPLPGE